ncbi:glycosyltransferase [Geomonas sp.]|uniref:glycosyltransferase n=1 Tax=Geomonas sp. TaxID=2651584 RepID=UPI002B46DCAC|nr:glycosyltransferase [Geomonas sp.]HJV36215.1 glycosyltransferase [Geomonas sp.]
MKLLTGMCRELSSEALREVCHRRVKALDAICFLTYRCTSMCRTCTIWQRKGCGEQEMTREEWLESSAKLATYGIRSFEIFGGDALLRKDAIFAVTRYLSEQGVATYFPTNANLCDRDTVKQLIEAGLGTVYLSLDDLGEEQDEVRGVSGSFQRVREALENFAELRGGGELPCIIVCSTLSRLNFRNFPRLVEFLEQYPVNAIYPRPLGEFSRQGIEDSLIDGVLPEPYFASSDGESHLMDRGELAEMYRMIEGMQQHPSSIYVNWRAYYSTTDDTFLHGEYPLKECRIASTVVTVNPNGDVVPCPFFRSYVLGNLKRGGLEEIWGNERHRRFLAAQREGDLAICKNCNSRTYYTSLAETLDYYRMRALERVGLFRLGGAALAPPSAAVPEAGRARLPEGAGKRPEGAGEKTNPKVMHVLLSLDAGGGAESIAYELIRDQRLAGNPPIVCCLQVVGALGKRLQEDGFGVFFRARREGFDHSLIKWLADIIRQERVDVVHAHQYTPMFYSVPAAFWAGGVPVIYTEHGRLYPDRRIWKRSLVNPLLALGIRHVVAISHSTRLSMARLDRLPRKRIEVIHNGVDPQRMLVPGNLAELRRELGLKPSWRVVGMAARLEQIKNIDMALRAFALVVATVPDCCLVIAGFGSRRDQLQGLAAELGIASRVFFVGLRHDLPELYQLMEVFVLSSFTEGISVTLLEAMASGVPAVVTAVGGNPEVVVEGETGYLVEVGDHQGMAERILRLLADRELARQVGERGRARVEAAFSIDGMRGAYRSLYCRAAERHSAPIKPEV